MNQVYEIFPDREDCIRYLEKLRWDATPVCPYCESDNSTPCKNNHRHHCNNCNTSYSVTVNSLFHKTKLDLQKWFLAIGIVTHSKNRITTGYMAEKLDVTKNTAWFVLNRLRKGMVSDGELLNRLAEDFSRHFNNETAKHELV